MPPALCHVPQHVPFGTHAPPQADGLAVHKLNALMKKTVIRWLWALAAAVVVIAAAAITAIAVGWVGYVPPVEQLDRPIDKFASQVISSDNHTIGTYARSENRVFVPYNKISPYVSQALVATEDIRFYEHSGIDFKSLVRAVVKRGLMGDRTAGGGSTITQQLAKQLYSANAENMMKRIIQKPVEWVIAVKIERNYTKNEIITLYLNYFDFLHNAVGIKTAAETYFGKQPANLSLEESATLVGMVKNPAYFNPVREPERCRGRRNVVLKQMLKAGYISQEECQKACSSPLKLNFHPADHKDGIATYFREFLRRRLMAKKPERGNYASWQTQEFYDDSLAWETDPMYGWCNKHTKRDGSHYNIYTDGLKIHTTIDSRMQRYAEESVRGHVEGALQPLFNKEKRNSATAPFSSALTAAQVKSIMERAVKISDRYRSMKAAGCSEEEIKQAFRTPVHMSVYSPHGSVDTVMTPYDSIRYYKGLLRAGFMVMDPHNGYVKAYVGGPNYHYFQYDMCTEGRRQIGSTIKPFLYSLAMENGWKPCDVVLNVRRSYRVGDEVWSPSNASHARYGQLVTLKWALSQSNNWVSAYLMSRLSPAAFVELIHSFGVTNQNIYPSLALSLGPCEMSVSEITSAYTAFVNKGIRVCPLYVTKIEDSDGNVVAEFYPRMNEVISEESSLRMLEMLQAVIDHGTGRRIRYKYHITAPMAGKTGTTNRHSDGWFVGLTPRLTGACWVGGENRDIHFDTMTYGQGASMAMPIWAYFMKKVYRDKSLGYTQKEEFDYPPDYSSCGKTANDSLQYSAEGIDRTFE